MNQEIEKNYIKNMIGKATTTVVLYYDGVPGRSLNYNLHFN